MFDQKIPFSDAAVVECDGVYGLFVDSSQFRSTSEECVAVAHDAGHIMTGTTHRVNSRLDLITRHENRADRWAIQKLIPVCDFDQAVGSGLTEVWQLADFFNVTEEFMRKAICLYLFGNVDADEFFPA